MSDGPFLGDVSLLSRASHFLGPLAGFHRRLREIVSVVAACSRVSWGGRSLREQRAQSPHPAGQDRESRDGEQGEEGPTALGDPGSSTPDLETPPAPKAAGVTHNATVLFEFQAAARHWSSPRAGTGAF